eukprot:IDg23795t1
MPALFGSLAKSKLVTGTVLELLTSTVHGRARNLLKVKWLVNDRDIIKTLHLRSVRPGAVPSSPLPQRNPISDTQPVEIADAEEEDDERPKSHEDAYSALARDNSAVLENNVGPFDCHGALWLEEEKMVRLTSASLRRLGKPVTSVGEMLRFFGILVLATRYEFGNRAELWSNTAATKHLDAPAFGHKTGVPRKLFDTIWQCLAFSETLDANTESSSTRRRWSLISDFIDAFNTYRASNFKPSESISRWYGQGGSWIEHGLPMCVAIDRKPENGCEIQNSACGRSGIMMRLHLVTTAED